MCIKPFIITIDGPAGTGKSTVAKYLAATLGFTYFDTGALYRAISWKVLQEKLQLDDAKALENLLSTFSFHIKKESLETLYFVGEIDVTIAIRTKEVTAIVSKVSALNRVREALKPIQLSIAKEGNTVFEGRDLGTVVFPNADLKFFLTARLEVRAERRYQELKKKFPTQPVSFDKILKEIEKRDRFDSDREIAPLKQAQDAILVDTSSLEIHQVVDQMKSIYGKRVQQ